MAHRTVHRLTCFISLLALTSATKEQDRWSRQLSSYTADISDWIPLDGPIEREPEKSQPQIKRQAVAEPRILTEPFPGSARPTGFNSDAFSARNYFNNQANRQVYLQTVPAVPSAPQNFLTDQGFNQGIRFGLSQPNFQINQGFVAPALGYESAPQSPQSKPVRPQILQGIPMNPVSFPQGLGAPLPLQGKPFANQAQKVKSDIPKFVDGYRAENASNDFDFSSKKKAQSLQKIKFDSVENVKQEIIPHRLNTERGEEVQLLYVPLEQLNRGQFNFRSPLTTSQLVNAEMFSQNLPRPNKINQNFLNDYRQTAKPLDTFSGQNYFSDFNAELKDPDQVPKFTTHSTPFASHAHGTPKPKKLKPHQPPLAIFMKDVGRKTPLKVGDVLSSLKTAETIAVLDSVNPISAPRVFIGPSNMPPPENFVKFELPYLSNIDHSDNKLKQLPFFVAPLSYNTPNGFAKIPFPSPHVGSVVINSQIKETGSTQATSKPNINPNYYVANYKPEPPKPVTQKPSFSYYSTASPMTKPVPNYQSNYYSFEPQMVTSLRTPLQPETQTAPPKTGSYFLSNTGSQYKSQEFANFAPQNNYKSSEISNQFNRPRQPERTTTLRTTTKSTTTKQPSTYPSQLLETHNPYSINQAFHFSTPLDYHNYFDDVKQPYITPGSIELSSPSPTPEPPSPSTSKPKPEHVATEKPKYQQQSSPNYLDNYSPEIHYDSDRNNKYPVFNPNDYIGKNEATVQPTQTPNYVDNTQTYNHITKVDTSSNIHNTNLGTPVNQYTDHEVNNYNVDTYNKYNTNIDTPINNYKENTEPHTNQYNTNVDIVENYKTEYNQNFDTSSPEPGNPSEVNNLPAIPEEGTVTKYDENNSYGVSQDIADIDPTTTTSTTTTTTRRTAIRSRGRPRYSTTPRSDSYESTTRVVVSRRPLRERRPQSTRQKFEPNKISTEKPVRKPADSSESTTKSSRSRTRGRIHYRPSDNDESYDKRKTHSTKEQDLAYQRDVLHQNYPVTLMERASTVDIEAITEPTHQQPAVNVEEPATETADTENAYTHERAAVSEQEEVKDISPISTFTSRNTLQTETPYVSKLPSTRNEEYYYQSRSSLAPVEASGYDETTNDKEEDIYVKQTTPGLKPEKSDAIAYATETSAPEQNVPNYSNFNEYATIKQEEDNTASEVENTKVASSENTEIEEEENSVQTTPSYNRVRVRPGVLRQYHQASSTESPKIKERRRPSQPVTYRPAFDRRRTTMRIDEIEAGLKTKQVHARPEQEYNHPVYKPEATTLPTVVSSSTTESSTKRNHYRRRRPSYSTTSTEASSTKRVYDVKNRFRGRRPTEKPSEKPDIQTEAPSSTTRTSLHTRYSHRPRLSERYNKKPEPEVEVEDQDSNFSINRPSYAEAEGAQWSPKISSDSFKPFNPNDIIDELRSATTEHRPEHESELDIITARNEYEDILLTVTPASNNRMKKKIPDVPPTLEALLEQSKVTKSDTTDTMSTFESMLEEVMKSLEEQDKDEYNSNVMKHKGGEIGEIPPEIVISSEEGYGPKSIQPLEETTTELFMADDPSILDEDNKNRKSRRRGFWKKVKVRPVTESIEFAESQYYTNTVNRLGQPVKNMKVVHEKTIKSDKPKVTTYKPKFQYLSDFFSSGDDVSDVDVIPAVDIHKIKSKESAKDKTTSNEEKKETTAFVDKETQTVSPGDLDLGTGSPDPTVDNMYLSTPTEPISTKASALDRSDTFSFMNYLFGMTSEGSESLSSAKEKNTTKTTESDIQITTEQTKTKIVTTESGFIPEEITEITSSSVSSDSTDAIDIFDKQKIYSLQDAKTEKDTEDTTDITQNVESTSVSSFMDPSNILSTSMSTEVSHETEICFRGKCIKTNKDVL